MKEKIKENIELFQAIDYIFTVEHSEKVKKKFENNPEEWDKFYCSLCTELNFLVMQEMELVDLEHYSMAAENKKLIDSSVNRLKNYIDDEKADEILRGIRSYTSFLSSTYRKRVINTYFD